MAVETPNSFKDPFWTDLASGTEQKLGLPKGLLVAVLTRGERSNADQVSEAGARTPFQIIPATRKAAIDKYGVDPYLSPENAAEVAGRLLKESMDRNGGSAPLAVAEYIGGTDRTNWGQKTKAYVQRVVGAVPAAVADAGPSTTTTLPPGPDPMQPTPAGQSTFDRVSAALGVGKPQPSQIAQVFQAYQGGQLTSQERKDFEDDVNAGRIMLPRGASLQPQAAAAGVPEVPPQLLTAFANGDLTAQEMGDFEHDVRAGLWKLPQGVDMQALLGDPMEKKGVLQRLADIPGNVREAITGAQRATPESQSLPEWTGMPEMNQLSMASAKAGLGTLLSGPDETAQILKANFPSMAQRRDGKGNWIFTSPTNGKDYVYPPGFTVGDVPRAAGAVAAFTPAGRAVTLPGMAVGAGLTQAAIETSQAATGGEFNPGEVATAAALAPVLPAAVNAVRAVAGPVRSGVARVLGRAEQVAAEAPGSGAAAQAAGPANKAPTTAPEARPIGNGSAPIEPTAPPRAEPAARAPSPSAAIARAAGEDAQAAGTPMLWRNADTDIPVVFKRIEPQAGPDGRMYARVEANGRESFVPADELIQAPGGAPAVAPAPAALAAEFAPGAPAAPSAANLTPEELGQATRRAAAGGIGSGRAQRTVAREAAPDPEVMASAKRLGIEDYLQPDHVTTNQAFRELSQVLKSVPGSASGAAERQGLEQVAKRADDLITEIGGTHDLSTLDASVKGALASTREQLKGKADALYDKVRAAVPAKSEVPATNVIAMIEQRAGDLGGTQYLSGMEKQILAKLAPKPVKGAAGATDGVKQPTYALLDDVRRDLTAAKFKRAGAFKDADDRLVDMLQGALREDQQAAAGKFGMGDTWDLAQKTAAAYKGVQDDMKALFGRELEGTIVGDLSKGITGLSKGDTSRFVQLMRSVPENMRQEVVASGLATAFGKSARNGSINFGSYSRWFEGLQKNRQAYHALMANLPASARRGLSDLYTVSNAISKATRERITTGRLSEGMRAIEKQLEPADTLMARVYQAAAKSTGGVAAEAFTSSIGMPGAGTAAAIASALRGGPKSGAFEAADKMFASPEFVRLARAPTPEARAEAARQFASGKNFTRFVRTIGSPRELSNRERWVLQAMLAGQQERAPTR
ncbi:hypothetical protein CDN99_26085 [Roseateles aquatilis]|uniref:Transglycosylase SLT domain-containing protein n=1 Tax=Roseateles aquatilis TaxID=431061 RepID=A0A246ITQ0_9BURK|nr:transglycosylase SLT domain-containing protein [Roseateles aquatilis]OWQ83602.1 hypothetical protein CDN99_26085 [Roseateles aquatilis]